MLPFNFDFIHCSVEPVQNENIQSIRICGVLLFIQFTICRARWKMSFACAVSSSIV